MSATCGKDGKILYGTHTVLLIRDWRLDADMEVIKLSYFQNVGLVKKACGPYDWKGTFSGDFDLTGDALGQGVIITNLLAGTSATIVLYVSDTQYFTGTAYIQAVSINSNSEPGNVSTIEFTFEGSGDLAPTS